VHPVPQLEPELEPAVEPELEPEEGEPASSAGLPPPVEMTPPPLLPLAKPPPLHAVLPFASVSQHVPGLPAGWY
jgi:hypothetical protein